jgi:RHH-type proline utilization regulon transcriptional repressor/proline dehydrogenase/delta 1-pyrroline-5-carboxylate dehydrogenase
VRSGLAAALAEVDGALPLSIPVTVGADSRPGDELLSTDPGAPARVVAAAACASSADVSAAVSAAAASAWRSTPAAERAAALVRAADWMRSRRLSLAALQVRECAKPWPEADADVCEAIDFLEYYAREAVALAEPRRVLQVSGERNEVRYVARGVVAVISPWNFPLAIPCGMVAAALATGNAVVLKPAEQAPGSALRLVEALRFGGVPASAVSLLPGLGDVGAALVRHHGVHTIAFTGSQPVGLEILAAAAAVQDGQRHIKSVVAELGGKNCVIVDSDADLDEAVPGIVESAFRYAGPKCSAASRVLVHERVFNALIGRLAGAVALLRTGQAQDLGTDVPPMIESAARERVLRYLALASSDGSVVAVGNPGPSEGWFCAPSLVTGLDLGHPVLVEEIFGPLLAVSCVRSVAEACDLVDALPFALTGGLFSRNPRTVALVRARTPVGNLYVNRGITGAMVARQPFGGNRLSGTGSKAGGPDYLLRFVEPRAVTESTMRHGLVV